MRSRRLVPIFLLVLAPLLALPALTGDREDRGFRDPGASRQQETEPFDEALLYVELNDTDGDLGLHGLIDGDAWETLRIVSPDGRQNLTVTARGSLREQGLTELFFESEEPTFDELAPEEFFERFPEGPWTISGRTSENDGLQSVVTLRHVMPAPPANVRVNGQAAAENCDADPLPAVSAPVTLSWDPVTASHPEIGESGSVDIVRYQLVVEREEPSLLVFSVDLPPGFTSFTVPEGFTALGDAFKFEILAIEASGNRTAVETCFEIE
jgi:hypothetical protein